MAKITVFLGITLFLASLSFAADETVITTYYPSPYGYYRELKVNRSVTYAPVTSLPADGKEGELVFLNNDKKFYYYSGGWKALGGSPEVVTAAYWNSYTVAASNIWQPISAGWPPTPVSIFSIPSDARKWACSYSVKGYCGGSCCAGATSRVICNGNEIYNQAHGISFSTSNMAVQSSNNVNCEIQFKSLCPGFSPLFSGEFGGNCYYVK